ncbi:Aste57867_8815 [Aphanomyces stellatus]|uniref:Aste57867_8815 protein n=1 Tax=Aphanomyces stellatus TaxID=120398 RepID=A0A485KLC1_9STRA|nr:hypothetical protein As57867_008780 [Aphanomyces stellatus]VFT85701.1 Aste57867_8815 [Aphanomyces stellatus]
MLARVAGAVGRCSLATSAQPSMKHLIQDANKNPLDPLRQLRVLQALNQIHPSFDIQPTAHEHLAMSSEARYEYLHALSLGESAMDVNVFLARIQSTGAASLVPKDKPNMHQRS